MNELKEIETFHRRRGSATYPSMSTTDKNIINDNVMPSSPFEEWFETFLIYIDNPVTNENMNKEAIKKRTNADNNLGYVPFLQLTKGGDSLSSRRDDLIDSKNVDQYPYEYGTNSLDNIDSTNTKDHANFENNIRWMGYKVMIVCHLYSVAHVSIDVYVKQLYDSMIRQARDATNNNNTFNRNDIHRHPAYSMLCWLYRMGLDVTKDI